MNNNAKDTSAMKTNKEKVLVCPADPNNIVFMFIPLMCFIEEIEQSLELKQG